MAGDVVVANDCERLYDTSMGELCDLAKMMAKYENAAGAAHGVYKIHHETIGDQHWCVSFGPLHAWAPHGPLIAQQPHPPASPNAAGSSSPCAAFGSWRCLEPPRKCSSSALRVGRCLRDPVHRCESFAFASRHQPSTCNRRRR